jgi:hypothetical protein
MVGVSPVVHFNLDSDKPMGYSIPWEMDPAKMLRQCRDNTRHTVSSTETRKQRHPDENTQFDPWTMCLHTDPIEKFPAVSDIKSLQTADNIPLKSTPNQIQIHLYL